jgi:hypothetical protein
MSAGHIRMHDKLKSRKEHILKLCLRKVLSFIKWKATTARNGSHFLSISFADGKYFSPNAANFHDM